MGSAKLDRLTLNESRLQEMARGLEEVAELPDPIGKVFDESVAASGMQVQKVRVPLGVILFIYESRPNITSDAAAFCLKASNAMILRGGSEAKESNAAIVVGALRGAGQRGPAGRRRPGGARATTTSRSTS